MFAVDDILVSDDVLSAPFSCNLRRCLGGCCVHGDRGAPLQPDEREQLEAVLPAVRHAPRPEALAVIDDRGVWEETDPDQFYTTTVNDRECVFVTYDGPVAKCAIQNAFYKGKVDWEKPISCHLFPIREETIADTTVLNYERIDLCKPAIQRGARKGVDVVDFLEAPLTRRFGADWYARFRETARKRAAIIGL